ncbi:hypothetical protein HS088_TW02G00420 [Tripterygium wilfordii]|uniref:RING-CH-type domain-containing protein n=1 Tax=Tripterygium wilfordii TaxID=458696 RepID=A0A7J7DZA8_TRIWF|nr:E3 ubiquitin-protein ligase MARCHF3-like [Tripterygium wilfordii]KAF5751406.1 hypothetical protein HS088_TW02G00420 [Tripterygium wilfordii]
MFYPHYYRGHDSRDGNDLSLSSESSGEIGAHRESSASDCISEEDLESGALETKVHSRKNREKDCRICHLGLESGGELAIELGCSCKGDLGAAHRKCAETWFKFKGNMICEICGATAVNVAGDQVNEAHTAISVAPSTPVAPVIVLENPTFWHGRRIMNLLLACMVFAFIISWLFHFKVIR